MAVSLQNLRSNTSGVSPASLLPGQLCFNLIDQTMFVGDGSDYKTSFEGSQITAPPGEGWFEVPLSLTLFSTFFLENPERYGSTPSEGQALIYSSALGRPVWESLPDTPGSIVYTTTNTEVDAAPGSTVNDKISAVIGVTTPNEGDSVIVSGSPGDIYQGLYLYQSSVWTYAAGYAFPNASQVPYDNTGTVLLSTNVQDAIDEVLQIAQTGLTTAENALPLTGGTMTGDINFNDGQLIDAGTF